MNTDDLRCQRCGMRWPCGDPTHGAPRPTGADATVRMLGEVEDGLRCPRCGSTNPAVRRTYTDAESGQCFPCPNDEWHDRPTGADPHADDPSCPTCGGTKKLLLGDVFMCTDTWHRYRCHCGKPAVRLIRSTVSLDASSWPGIPVCGDIDR